METLHEFDKRIGMFQTNSVPDEPVFGLPPSLEEKVAPRVGSLLPFHGDTIAYFLDDQVRELVGLIATTFILVSASRCRCHCQWTWRT